MLALVCFVAGGLVGWGAARGSTRVQRVWPVVLRAQILATSATLSSVAAWRLTSASQLIGPLALAAGMWVMFAVAVGTRGSRSPGEGALEAWAVVPNSGFWVVPTATAFAGSTGTMIAVLANVITTAWGAVCVHLMRRDAPIRQRHVNELGRPVADRRVPGGTASAPVRAGAAWTADVLTLGRTPPGVLGGGPVHGVVIHPHNLSVPRSEHALRRWSWLTAVRVAYFLLIVLAAALTSSNALAVVAALSALSAPSFQPVQLAVLYGYRSHVVVAAVRTGWLLAPFGLVLAAVVR